MYQRYNFEKLGVYQLAKELLREIYSISKNFPKEEIFVLVFQIRRAMISVVLNIAEGSLRTKKEFARFIEISIGSLLEVKTCLDIAKDLNYIQEKDFKLLIEKIDKLFFKLLNLKKYLKR